MKLKWFAICCLSLLSAPVLAAEPAALKTEKDKVNYGIGVNFMNTIRQQGVTIDLDLVIKGMKDVNAGGALLLNNEELSQAISQYHIGVRQKQSQLMTRTAEDNKKAGEAFLAENGKKDGVVTLPSGLQYEILKAGEGRIPAEADTVECHYRGAFVNGTEFDSTYRTGVPALFKLSTVIAGWREAFKLMPVGSKWRIFVPAPLAYGTHGKPGSTIGPNMVLIYELELIAIK